MVRISCNLCKHNEIKNILRVKEYYLFSSRIFDIGKCCYCGLVFIYPPLSNEELSKYYPDRFYEVPPEDKLTKIMSIFPGRDKISIVEKTKKKGKILDIGCARGGFLEILKNRGWEAYGVDISTAACKYAKEKLGENNVFNGDITSLELTENYFDVITMWHVIEHATDPLAVLKEVYKLLGPGGSVIINCPNYNSWQRVIFKNNWFALCAPQHLFHFTPVTLYMMLKQAGFSVIKKDYINDVSYNTNSMKLSILRAVGLGKMTAIESKSGEEMLKRKPVRLALWKILRFFFNVSCLCISVVFHFAGNREQLLFHAKK
ncbi:MAG: hypothetical protein A2452_03345 [Candidatus Firestonebacteria bacterium RIFOXYC2_FULL_39_67]|nr:MAG: hypothetical protein A2536_02760 [Candidatus Firestonebacteria bacterium RIFOXYD2_FULL_39_29]OGF55303.1 MAG: hypothetical protein A2452_03345 [Candidatus Firestonebacteria bacterium RIFOXYC2_FULL_39_67]